MRLIYSRCSLEVALNENATTVLCIENNKAFSESVTDLWIQSTGGEGKWILSDETESLPLAKNLICVINPVSLNLNDKRLLKVLYQDIATDVQDNMYDQLCDINSKIVTLLDEAIQHQPYAIEFGEDLEIESLLKIYGVVFSEDVDGMLEKIVTYIKLWHRVVGIKVFSFVNLKTFLSDEEVIRLYEMVRYEQVYLLLLEARLDNKMEGENVTILDKDLCVIAY